jgi:HNH endonuclease
MTVAERLDRLSARDANSDCILFIGAGTSDGYGMITIDGKRLLAHRVAYELKHGPIPEGFTIDHKCPAKRCINDAHHEVVTQGVNTRRAHLGKFNTNCPRGHSLTGENLQVITRRNGWVLHRCRTCTKTQRNAARKKTAAETVR